MYLQMVLSAGDQTDLILVNFANVLQYELGLACLWVFLLLLLLLLLLSSLLLSLFIWWCIHRYEYGGIEYSQQRNLKGRNFFCPQSIILCISFKKDLTIFMLNVMNCFKMDTRKMFGREKCLNSLLPMKILGLKWMYSSYI